MKPKPRKMPLVFCLNMKKGGRHNERIPNSNHRNPDALCGFRGYGDVMTTAADKKRASRKTTCEHKHQKCIDSRVRNNRRFRTYQCTDCHLRSLRADVLIHTYTGKWSRFLEDREYSRLELIEGLTDQQCAAIKLLLR